MSFKIWWNVTPTNNPYVEFTFNGTPYADYWDNLTSPVDSPFKTLMSQDPDPQPTCTAEGSDEEHVTMTIGSDEEVSDPFVGDRPPHRPKPVEE